MPTIEFYGADGLEMTTQLAQALGRYTKYNCGLEGDWDFIGTNPDETNNSTSKRPIHSSLPVYYQGEIKSTDRDPFYSFDKLNLFDRESLKATLVAFLKKSIRIEEAFKQIETHLISSACKTKIEILNIQSGDFSYWNKKVDLLEKNEPKKLYIFIWSLKSGDSPCTDPECLKKKRKENEIHDKIWGYSKFMRDFLKIRNHCFEWELNELEDFIKKGILKELVEKKFKKINEKEASLGHLIKKSKKVLKHYGLPSKDFGVTDLSMLHLYNRNNHFNSCYFEDKFKFIKGATGSSHQLLNEKDKYLLDPGSVNLLGALESKLFFYDLFKNVTDACINYSSSHITPDFIFLDDLTIQNLKKPDNQKYLEKYCVLYEWFPKSSFYYTSDRNFLNYFFSLTSSVKVNKFPFPHKGKSTICDTTFPEVEISSIKSEGSHPLFIGIDIDWNGEDYGLELLKEFRRNVHLIQRPCFIFVFSRYEYPSAVRKAIASGALFYVTKQNYLNLVPRVHLILRRMEKNPNEIVHFKYHTYENWHLLKKLEPAKIIQLKSEVITGCKLEDLNNEVKQEQHEWRWINKLPKADLHCHIGSCLKPEILPLTALAVLSEKYIPENINTKEELTSILSFVSLFVNGLIIEDNKLILRLPELSRAFGISDDKGCLFEGITTLLGLKEKQHFPEAALLDPHFSDMDLAVFGTDNPQPYFQLRQKLKRMGVNYDTVMLFFILLIFVKEKGIQNKDKFTEEIKNILNDVYKREEEIDILINEYIKNSEPDLKSDIKGFIGLLFRPCITNDAEIQKLLTANDSTPNILKKLQTAADGKSGSLFNYLRGCEYGGAPHLQTKISIYLACYSIVHGYALPNNIRYLTLRCAVNGYTKLGLLKSNEEAMEALLKGLDLAVKEAHHHDKKIHVDVILTAKRHKSLDEFSQNSDLALKYRHGLLTNEEFNEIKDALKDKLWKVESLQELRSFHTNLPDYLKPAIDPAHNDVRSFFNSKPKVVSFDLAGLEKGNRAGKFYEHFLPLLKKCFPITIHAGEEDSHEAIWEAIYEVQSQRIGHGLTLRNNKELLDTVKDRHIAIELCPVSNILTRNGKSWKPLHPINRNNSKEYNQDVYYPLRQYLMENIDVTINTDNPFVSGTTLTDEFLVAAKMAGGLTKWEVLRLIKNSFRSAALPKEQKKRLMDEIDDEIYNFLLDER